MSLNYSRSPKNEWAGFTLSEALIALFVVASISFLFIPLIRISERFSQNLTNTNQLDIHTFLIQLQRSINQAEFVKVENHSLFLKEKNPNITQLTKISRYRQMIRRQKNKGHEPLLMNVLDLRIKQEKNNLKVVITFLNGEVYQNSLFYHE